MWDQTSSGLTTRELLEGLERSPLSAQKLQPEPWRCVRARRARSMSRTHTPHLSLVVPDRDEHPLTRQRGAR